MNIFVLITAVLCPAIEGKKRRKKIGVRREEGRGEWQAGEEGGWEVPQTEQSEIKAVFNVQISVFFKIKSV